MASAAYPFPLESRASDREAGEELCGGEKPKTCSKTWDTAQEDTLGYSSGGHPGIQLRRNSLGYSSGGHPGIQLRRNTLGYSSGGHPGIQLRKTSWDTAKEDTLVTHEPNRTSTGTWTVHTNSDAL